MAGMVPVMMVLQAKLAPMASAASPAFWFVMSMALLAGFIVAYPMNWWLVANNLKHGMMTVRPDAVKTQGGATIDVTANASGAALGHAGHATMADAMVDAMPGATDSAAGGATTHAAMGAADPVGRHDMMSDMDHRRASPVPSVFVMTLLSFLALAIGVALSAFAGPMARM